MTTRIYSFVLTVILLTSFSAAAQTMNIHTPAGVQSFNLSDIDSITFGNQQERQPGEQRVFNLPDSTQIIMVWIPAGSFMMGRNAEEQDSWDREDPRHEVNIAHGFWISMFEVTQAQWVAVMHNNPSGFHGDNLPVENVSWNDVQQFEASLGGAFRLPSEAEWEYANRAGSTTRFYWGDDLNYELIGDYAWFTSNSNEMTHQVGSKMRNDWNLYDMSGNVWEWCEDYGHDTYNGAPNDGSAWVEGNDENRVLRGGSIGALPQDCRAAHRYWFFPDSRSVMSGFRVVRDGD